MRITPEKGKKLLVERQSAFYQGHRNDQIGKKDYNPVSGPEKFHCARRLVFFLPVASSLFFSAGTLHTHTVFQN